MAVFSIHAIDFIHTIATVCMISVSNTTLTSDLSALEDGSNECNQSDILPSVRETPAGDPGPDMGAQRLCS